MKKGLVMEGGAMRGMFTAGVTDVLMENNIEFDGAIGVSAGACFGCNYKSKQIGRTIRYNKKYCADKRYCGWLSWLKTGNFYNAEFDYDELPNKLDIFDTKTYIENPMEFYVVVTDVNSGRPVYYNMKNADAYDLLWMRASASMPLLSELVEIDGGKYSDGGMSDSIPLRYFEEIGYDRNIVITTQPEEFEKKVNKFLPIFRVIYRKYPEFVAALSGRHIMYNEQLKYIKKSEERGTAFIIRPPEPLNIKAGEKNANELERVYRAGRYEAEKNIEKIKEFLSEK